MSEHPWPDLPDEQRWALELMNERLERTRQSPQELVARAEELRDEAASTEIDGYRDAVLAMADRYERVAEVRATSA